MLANSSVDPDNQAAFGTTVAVPARLNFPVPVKVKFEEVLVMELLVLFKVSKPDTDVALLLAE